MSKVLIVDDAMFMRSALKMMLEKNGFEVVGEAQNGALAVQQYMLLKPDVVTMDITMPEMDGIEATKKIKANDPDAKILIVSALGQESFVKEAIIAGAKDFIVKPFKENILVEKINSVLSK